MTFAAPVGATTPDNPACQASNQRGDRFLFDLAPEWAIGFDDLQWLLLRRVNRKPGDRRSSWSAVAFIATERRILERVIREKGISLTDERRAALNALPLRFASFKAQVIGRAATTTPAA